MATPNQPIDLYYDVDSEQLVTSTGGTFASVPVFKYKQNALIRLRFVDSANDAYDGFDGTETFEFAVDTNFVHTDDLMIDTLDANINVAGDWADADATAGKFSIRCDCYNTGFETKVGTSASVNGYAEFYATVSGDRVFSIRFGVTCENTVKDDEDTPSAPATNYYTKTEVDSLIRGEMESYDLGEMTGATEIDVTDGQVQAGEMTGAITMTFTGWPSGKNASVLLRITKTGTDSGITWSDVDEWSPSPYGELDDGVDEYLVEQVIYEASDGTQTAQIVGRHVGNYEVA